MRYTNTPRYGRKMMKIHHTAFAHPDMSWLRMTSPNTAIKIQIQMKNRKNHSIDQKTSPVPKSAANNMSHTSGVFLAGGLPADSTGIVYLCFELATRMVVRVPVLGRHGRP